MTSRVRARCLLLLSAIFGQARITDKSMVQCNGCGKVLNLDRYGLDGTSHFSVDGGFLSKYLGDLNTYKFDLCERCIYKMFLAFKKKPSVYDNVSRKRVRFRDSLSDRKRRK